MLREREAIAAHVDAVGRLSDPVLRGGDGPILASAAQHLAALRAELGQAPVPTAFVLGAAG